jgi:chromosome segregation ATPase
MMVYMRRKETGKIPETAAARDRYFGAILEDVNGKFSLLLEGYGALDVKMDRLERRMDGLEKRMDGLEEKMDRLERRMDEMEAKIETFRAECKEKFTLLFDGQQEFFEAMRRFNRRLTTLEGGR